MSPAPQFSRSPAPGTGPADSRLPTISSLTREDPARRDRCTYDDRTADGPVTGEPADAAVGAQAGADHPPRRRSSPHRRDHPPLRGRRGHRHLGAEEQRIDRAARGDRARDVRPGQDDPGRGRGAPERAQAAAHPAQRGLADRPGPRLPGPLPVLLPRRLAQRSPGHPGVRQPRRGAGGDRDARRLRSHHQRHGRTGTRGDDLRAVLLHRPVGHRARDRLAGDRHLPGRRRGVRRPGLAALHHQVRRRVGAALPRPRWPTGSRAGRPGCRPGSTP
jgi:hypothetical protein